MGAPEHADIVNIFRRTTKRVSLKNHERRCVDDPNQYTKRRGIVPSSSTAQKTSVSAQRNCQKRQGIT